MILYFSGTGTAAYAAQRIGAAIGDTVVICLRKSKAVLFPTAFGQSMGDCYSHLCVADTADCAELAGAHPFGRQPGYLFCDDRGDSFAMRVSICKRSVRSKTCITWGVWKLSCRRITLPCILRRSRQRLWASSGKQTV